MAFAPAQWGVPSEVSGVIEKLFRHVHSLSKTTSHLSSAPVEADVCGLSHLMKQSIRIHVFYVPHLIERVDVAVVADQAPNPLCLSS